LSRRLFGLSRHCEERSDEAIQCHAGCFLLDRFAALAMTQQMETDFEIVRFR